MGRCFYQDIAPTIRTRTDGANMDFIMEEVKVINPLKGQSDNGWHFEQQVYDAEGIARAVKAGEGSGNIPKVIEVGRVKEGRHQQDFVQHEEGICRCICTGHHASTPHLLKTMVSEPISVAMRGRNPNNLSERGKSNGNYKQRLEMNESGVANTITSVQKDSMVAEPQVKQVGNIVDDTNIGFKNPQRGRVYSDEGLAPCLNCCEGGGLEPKIVQKFGDRGTDQYSVRNIAHTIPANPMSDRGQMLLEPSENWQTIVGNKQLNPFRGSVEGTSPCITSACGAGGGMTPMLTDADLETTKTKEFIEQVRGHEQMRYRIRKLTPRECFRLMGVDDADIDKMQVSGISNSQQYKCAGNSIVVDVLYHIFRKMFVETENESDQLCLF